MRERAYRRALTAMCNGSSSWGSQPMEGKSTNAGEQMEMLVVQISDEGHALIYKAA